MARDNRLFKTHCNQLLELFADLEPGTALGSEIELAGQLDASRTTVRAVLAHLTECGIVTWDGRTKHLVRRPVPSDFFNDSETRSMQDVVEERFLRWILQGDVPPDTVLNEAQLARDFGVSVGAVREFLIRFTPFGLIEKRPNRSWLLKGFTRAFADEMFTVREVFERLALRELLAETSAHQREEMNKLAEAHRRVIEGSDNEALAFPELDTWFHQTLCGAAHNRFISDFSRMIAIIVHFHYRWNKVDEIRRNRTAAAEHLEIIEAVLAGDGAAATAALDRHLMTAYRTLIASVRWSTEDSGRLRSVGHRGSA
ncbi:transcriptional regulator, GntR family [Mesorhizobium sp. YR577]|nr:transcriptional regulator, GntR family [Mesorhizobium sp. YR577]